MYVNDILNKRKKEKEKAKKIEMAKNTAIGVGVGTALGAGLALLLAPRSGKDAREGIANTYNSAVDNLKTSSNEAREKINGILKKSNKEDLVEDGFLDIDASEIE